MTAKHTQAPLDPAAIRNRNGAGPLTAALVATLLSAAPSQEPGNQPPTPEQTAPQQPGAGEGEQAPEELPDYLPRVADDFQVPDDNAESIRELTLEEALSMGRFRNIDLRQAELLPGQAVQDKISAEAFYEPEIYGNVAVSRSRSPTRNAFQPAITRDTLRGTIGWRQRVITGGQFQVAFAPTRLSQSTAGGTFPSLQYDEEISLQFTQPLLRGGWSDYGLAEIRIARFQQEASQLNFDQTVQDTLLEVVRAYWELVFARENYKVVYSALDVAREQLRITTERIRVRDLAPRDRIADEAEVAGRKEELLTAENEIARRQDALRRLLFDGQDGEIWRRGLVPISPIEVPIEDPGAWQESALIARARRADLASLRTQVETAQQRETQADRDLLPQLDVTGSYRSQGNDDDFRDTFQDVVSIQFPDWSIALDFSIPVGNRAAKANLRRARLEVERSRRAVASAELDSDVRVRDAVRDLRRLAQAIESSRESVRLEASSLETEQIKLRVGTSNPFDVQQANQNLRLARSRLLRNLLDYRIAEYVLLHVQGALEAPAPEDL